MPESDEQPREARDATPSSRVMGIRLSAEERGLLEQLVELGERRVYGASGVRLKLTMTAVLRTLVLREAEREGLLRPEAGTAPRGGSSPGKPASASPPSAPPEELGSAGARPPPAPAPTPQRVKQWLRAALEEGRWNQSRLAEASGVTRQRIGAFWRGQRPLEPGELEALARVLDASPR